MQCKNCGSKLRTDYSYCPNCGAKVIRNRITFKNLWYDIIERYFNWDNTFLKTFVHLITNPSEVIDSYITGVRRKYLNPISFLAIAISLSGINLFIMRKYAWDKIDFSSMVPNKDGEGMQKVMEFTLDFSSFVFLLYIPIIAFAGYIMFNKKNHNLSEHFVTSMYLLANFSLMSFVFSTTWLLLNPAGYFTISYYTIAFMFAYSLYVYIRTSSYGTTNNLFRSLGFLMICLIGFLGVGIFMNIIWLLTGVMEISDFLPKPAS